MALLPAESNAGRDPGLAQGTRKEIRRVLGAQEEYPVNTYKMYLFKPCSLMISGPSLAASSVTFASILSSTSMSAAGKV